MSVVVSIEETGPCRRELKIEVPQPAVEAEAERVTAEYRKRANLPGFRKGKAPKALVAKRFAAEIQEDVVERLVPRYWHQAEAEKELQPILPPQLKLVDYEPGHPMTFVAVVELRPEIELGDLEDFDLPSAVTEPTEEEIERHLTEMRRRVADWKEVERPAAQGDLVRVKIVTGENEDELSFEVGEPRVWEELSVSVQGLEAGQKASFERTVGEGDEAEKKSYTVEVQKVEEIELPELNAELAQKISRFETVEELRGAVAVGIRGNLEKQARRSREQALLRQLRERHPLQLPEGVVDNELESQVREYAHELGHQGVDLEKADIDWGQVGEQLRPRAEAAVHTRLLLDAIADEREIEVPEETLEALLAELARSRDSTPLAVRRELDRSGRLASLRQDLRRQETVRELLGERRTDVQSEADAASDEPAEE